jgi:sarcosine oxidase, subunit gamma
MLESDHWSAAGPGVEISEVHGLTLARLRAHGPDEAVQALARSLGVVLPADPNTVTDGPVRSLWLGPREWLLVNEVGQSGFLGDDGGVGVLHHLDSASDAYAVFDLAGPGCGAILSRGCSIDLHPASLAASRCAQTLIEGLPVILERQPAGFRLYASAALRWYFRKWFEEGLRLMGDLR